MSFKVKRLAFSILITCVMTNGAVADTQTGIDAFKHTDYETALKELSGPAKEGDPQALYVLGKMYGAGLGVKKELARAAEYYRLAAEQTDAGSQYEFGTALVLGDGVKQDIAEAVKWLLIAARQGHAGAKTSAESLFKYRDRKFIRAAQGAARDWLKSFNAKSQPAN